MLPRRMEGPCPLLPGALRLAPPITSCSSLPLALPITPLRRRPLAVPLHILHIEDDATDALLVRRAIERNRLDARVTLVQSSAEYLDAIAGGGVDLILADNGLPGFSGRAALDAARARSPHVPFVFVSGAVEERQALSCLDAGAADFIAKDQLWRLVVFLRRLAAQVPASPQAAPSGADADADSAAAGWPLRERAMQRLVAAVQALSLARTLDAVMAVVRTAARELTGADGATFILRDQDKCFYADEDAIGPLWKGQRFPMTACISGWAMLNRRPAIIPDIYADARVPVDAYRPTFVKSLVMVPIRPDDPVGAIGNYWAARHQATSEEVELLQALANTASVAMEDVRLFAELEQRVRDRTLDLEAANRELEAFSYSVSHDLRAPLRGVGTLVGMLEEKLAGLADAESADYARRIQGEVFRMSSLIDDLLRLAKLSRLELQRQEVNLSGLAADIARRIQSQNPERRGVFTIHPGLTAQADVGLLRVVLENLLSNAWKYSGRRDRALIEFGAEQQEGSLVYFVRDNGAGFDMQFSDKLFAPFQRLHHDRDFKGHGIGLATVQRVIHRHGGRIWARAELEKGAAFYFTLP